MDIQTLKAQAYTNAKGQSHYETGNELIRCKFVGNGFEFRRQIKEYDPKGGAKINEAIAATLLARSN